MFFKKINLNFLISIWNKWRADRDAARLAEAQQFDSLQIVYASII